MSLYGQGDQPIMANGQPATPFPRVDLTTDRRATATFKRVDQWLIDNARRMLADNRWQLTALDLDREQPGKLPQATRDLLTLVLFPS